VLTLAPELRSNPSAPRPVADYRVSRTASSCSSSTSLRMAATLLESIKIEANKRDVPYQSPIKNFDSTSKTHYP